MPALLNLVYNVAELGIQVEANQGGSRETGGRREERRNAHLTLKIQINIRSLLNEESSVVNGSCDHSADCVF